MMQLWEFFSADSRTSIKRALAGPMGVGKSYIAIFLAAKAYAAGWPVLYIADAAKLAKSTTIDSAVQICKRFFALNNDILTKSDFQEIISDSESMDEAKLYAAGKILDPLLCRKNVKTLFITDEHGALFENNIPKPRLFTPLIKLTAWPQQSNGARVVFTGTSQSGYERVHITSDIKDWVEYVGPLSDNIFDKLLDLSKVQSPSGSGSPDLTVDAVKVRVKEITHNVPGELVKLVDHVVRHGGAPGDEVKSTLELVEKFYITRCQEFTISAKNYFYHVLSESEQHSQRNALSRMFRPDLNGRLAFEDTITEPDFMDRGFVYRERVGGDTMYTFLCPAAKEGLLNLYRDVPLPIDKIKALRSGDLSGDDLENTFIHTLVKHGRVILDTTNLKGEDVVPLYINAAKFDNITEPPTMKIDTFRRFYKDYGRFDFVYNQTFIQISASRFDSHEDGSAKISNAFEPVNPPEDSTKGKQKRKASSSIEETNEQSSSEASGSMSGKKRKKGDELEENSSKGSLVKKGKMKGKPIEMRNQIEVYLDAVYGGEHKVEINEDTKHFEASRNGVKLEDFKIVYICGDQNPPNYPGLFKKYPDLRYVSGSELRDKQYGYMEIY
ncbi:hypothetical protein BGZ76_005193 [Entomortierella beljakovae]|nr:hypothetical protein BGZ76_005193 [Entomortierella beljakovae]